MDFKEIRATFAGQSSKPSYGLPKKTIDIPEKDEAPRGSVKALVQLYENRIRETSKEAERDSVRNSSVGRLTEDKLYPYQTVSGSSPDMQRNRSQSSNHLNGNWLSNLSSSQESIIKLNKIESFSQDREALEKPKLVPKNLTEKKIAQKVELKLSDLKLDQIEEKCESCEKSFINEHDKIDEVKEDKIYEIKEDKIDGTKGETENGIVIETETRDNRKEKSKKEEKKERGRPTNFNSTSDRNVGKVIAKKVSKEEMDFKAKPETIVLEKQEKNEVEGLEVRKVDSTLEPDRGAKISEVPKTQTQEKHKFEAIIDFEELSKKEKKKQRKLKETESQDKELDSIKQHQSSEPVLNPEELVREEKKNKRRSKEKLEAESVLSLDSSPQKNRGKKDKISEKEVLQIDRIENSKVDLAFSDNLPLVPEPSIEKQHLSRRNKNKSREKISELEDTYFSQNLPKATEQSLPDPLNSEIIVPIPEKQELIQIEPAVLELSPNIAEISPSKLRKNKKAEQAEILQIDMPETLKVEPVCSDNLPPVPEQSSEIKKRHKSRRNKNKSSEKQNELIEDIILAQDIPKIVEQSLPDPEIISSKTGLQELVQTESVNLELSLNLTETSPSKHRKKRNKTKEKEEISQMDVTETQKPETCNPDLPPEPSNERKKKHKSRRNKNKDSEKQLSEDIVLNQDLPVTIDQSFPDLINLEPVILKPDKQEANNKDPTELELNLNPTESPLLEQKNHSKRPEKKKSKEIQKEPESSPIQLSLDLNEKPLLELSPKINTEKPEIHESKTLEKKTFTEEVKVNSIESETVASNLDPKLLPDTPKSSRISFPRVRDELVLSAPPITIQATPFPADSLIEKPSIQLLTERGSLSPASFNISEKSMKINIISPDISPTQKSRKSTLSIKMPNFSDQITTESLISEIDIICINCYECIRPEEIDTHSVKCLRPNLEVTEVMQADIRIRKMLKSITTRKQSSHGTKFSLYCKLEELSLAILEKSMSSYNIQDKLEEIFLDSLKISEGLPIVILSKRLQNLLELKGNFQNQENEKDLLRVYQEEAERQKKELEKWKLRSEMLLQLAGNPAGQGIDIDSDLGSGRNSVISFTTGFSEFSSDIGNLEDVEQVLQEISEEELEKHFYGICVRAKLALPKGHHLSEVPISEIYSDVRKKNIPVSQWKDFISSKFS